jgi:DNA-binding transcriptional MerR regulator
VSRASSIVIRTSMGTPPPDPDVYLSAEQVATACGLDLVRLYRLVRLGVIEPSAAGSRLFSVQAAARLRKILRLRADLGVNLAGAEIIVDLVARVERLQDELARLRPSAGKEMP